MAPPKNTLWVIVGAAGVLLALAALRRLHAPREARARALHAAPASAPRAASSLRP